MKAVLESLLQNVYFKNKENYDTVVVVCFDTVVLFNILFVREHLIQTVLKQIQAAMDGSHLVSYVIKKLQLNLQ